MIRVLWFMAKVAVLIAAAIWLSDNPGTLTVTWMGYVIETSTSVAVVIAVALLLAAAYGYRMIRAVLGIPAEIGRFNVRRRREKGLEALSRGMVAVAAGDNDLAQKMARKAEDLLHEPPLTRLLSAQAAQLRGDDRGAKVHFAAMLENTDTVFLGVRGLLTHALKDGDRVEALALARRAAQLQPQTAWVLSTLFELEARAGEWAAAQETLRRAVHAGAIKPEEGRHRRAALLLERSFEAERQGREDAALRHARDAHDLLPAFAPATSRYARMLTAAGQPRKANKAVTRTWRLNPTPELAAAFRQVVDSFDPVSRFKAFHTLTRQAPDNVESHLAMARAALDASLWGEARSHLEAARLRQPTRRVFKLLADLERAEHNNDDAARSWLLQGATAPEDPAWTCRACGATSVNWAGLCGNCGAFDSLDWGRPLPHGGHVALNAVIAGPGQTMALPSAAPVPAGTGSGDGAVVLSSTPAAA